MNISNIDNSCCSGCGLCKAICPTKAISMIEDELGYIFPKVEENKCIECGKCYSNCIILNVGKLVKPFECYAAARQDKEKISYSSSGGVFASISESVIEKKEWWVSGCILDDSFKAIQKLVFDKENLKSTYGSKYVQCSMENNFKEIADILLSGNKVLFSGTPCQVAAIKRYTNNNINLYTVEVICHGVSNNKMFISYLEMYNKECIKNFIFRDKKQGWSYNNKIVYKDGEEKKINHRMSSYMTYYLNGETYRESCYNCPYATESRGADLTIGDFWGVIKKRPELKIEYDIEKGISCLLVNTKKGKELLAESDLICTKVNYEDIKDGNEPLNCPSTHTIKRNEILNVWKKHSNWRDVDKYWKQNDYSLLGKIWSFVPIKIQHIIRIMLNKR